jgi:hypothetical protein
MKKYFILSLLSALSYGVSAQDNQKEKPKQQFIFIIRSKADYTSFPKDSIQSNIKHWEAYMGNLVRTGKIAGGYRPGNEGETISGPGRASKKAFYAANGEVVSSFLIINAADLAEADQIAKQCPVFELGGNIEIRPIMNTAN